jgi:hypothetical protein
MGVRCNNNRASEWLWDTEHGKWGVGGSDHCSLLSDRDLVCQVEQLRIIIPDKKPRGQTY